MGEFKKSGGFGRGGNPRTKRAEQSSYDGNPRVRRAEQSRRTQWHDEASHDGHSDRPRFSGEKRSFSHSGDRGGSRPQMFSAVCSECGRACEVPFRPTGDRPVFCNDCFSNKRGSSQGNFTRRDFTHPSSPAPAKPPAEDKRIDELKKQLDAVNKKLDTMMEMMKTAPVVKIKTKKSVKSKK